MVLQAVQINMLKKSKLSPQIQIQRINKTHCSPPVDGSLAKDLGTLIKKPVLHDKQKRRFASPPANKVELPGYPKGQTIPKSPCLLGSKSHLPIKESELADHRAANPF